MPQSVVGKWGKTLGSRYRFTSFARLDSSMAKRWKIEAQDGDIVVRPPTARAQTLQVAKAQVRQNAESAMEAIFVESRAHNEFDAAKGERKIHSNLASACQAPS